MFFSTLRDFVGFLLLLLNGKAHYLNTEKLPTEGAFILVAPHRTWIDPVYLALAAKPHEFSFMAKKELFKNPILSWVIRHCNAFPVDRKNPGPSAIKTPVKILKEGNLNLVIFPTGTRHSSELKGGAATIAKLSGVPIIPAVYQGPLTLKELVKRKRVTVNFGDSITIDKGTRLTKEKLKEIEIEIQQAFNQLDDEIDPTYEFKITP